MLLFLFWAKFYNVIATEIRMAVPRLVGQVVMYPKFSSTINLSFASIARVPLARSSNA